MPQELSGVVRDFEFFFKREHQGDSTDNDHKYLKNNNYFCFCKPHNYVGIYCTTLPASTFFIPNLNFCLNSKLEKKKL